MKYQTNFQFLFFLLIFFVSFQYLPAQTIPKRNVNAVFCSVASPKIDGQLNDEVWQTIEWQGDFTQRQPIDGGTPSMPTSFKVAYDNNNMYVAVRAWDSAPDSIVKRLSRRDNGDGDAIGIEFDTYFDKRSAFSFIVFASGGKEDKYISSDGDNEDEDWDAIWDVKTQIDADGWTAEYKIPLNQLRFNEMDEQLWGFQVGRFIYRKQELSLWQPIPRDASGWVHLYGTLSGLQGLKPKRLIEVAPYIVAKVERDKKVPDNPFQTGKHEKISGGIDAKIGVTNDITLDLTILPDFGQVEADPSEVNLTAFEIYFPEKRPFFIEAKNLFDFQFSPGDGDNSIDNLFYSRRIGRQPHYRPATPNGTYSRSPENTRILGAAKLTGKTSKGVSFGILDALTASEFAEIDQLGVRSKEMVEPLTNFFVGSFNKEFNQGNTQVGAMATTTHRQISETHLDFLHRQAYSGGLNFEHQWNNKNYFFTANMFFSHVEGSQKAILETQTSPVHYFQRTDASHLQVDSTLTSLTGHGGSVNIGKGGDGHWRFGTFLTWTSPQLEVNDIGFIRQTDHIFQVVWANYKIWEPFSIFRELRVNFNQWSGHNFAGERLYMGGNINVNSELKNYWSVGSGINVRTEGLNTTDLRGGPAVVMPGGASMWANVSSDERKDLRASLMFSLFDGMANTSQTIRTSLTYKPTDALVLKLSGGANYRQNLLQYVRNISVSSQNRYICATIDQQVFDVQLRVDYSLTPELSMQYYGRPYFVKAKYSDFKKITDARAAAFSDRFHVFNSTEIQFDKANNLYQVAEGNNTTYAFNNPNFNFKDFQSNLVLRWEFKPGSALYLVWSQSRDHAASPYENIFSDDLSELFNAIPHQIFLLKFSYRFY